MLHTVKWKNLCQFLQLLLHVLFSQKMAPLYFCNDICAMIYVIVYSLKEAQFPVSVVFLTYPLDTVRKEHCFLISAIILTCAIVYSNEESTTVYFCNISYMCSRYCQLSNIVSLCNMYNYAILYFQKEAHSAIILRTVFYVPSYIVKRERHCLFLQQFLHVLCLCLQ